MNEYFRNNGRRGAEELIVKDLKREFSSRAPEDMDAGFPTY
jgi:hypothetical protein